MEGEKDRTSKWEREKDKMRKEFRNEKLLMLNLLYIYFMRKKIDLENIISI